MSETLYRKVQQGNRVRYVPHVPVELSEALNDNMTVGEIVSAVGGLAVLAIHGYQQLLPPKSCSANRVKAVQESVLKMFKDTGTRIDNDIMQHVVNTWNKTMWRLSGKGDK